MAQLMTLHSIGRFDEATEDRVQRLTVSASAVRWPLTLANDAAVKSDFDSGELGTYLAQLAAHGRLQPRTTA